MGTSALTISHEAISHGAGVKIVAGIGIALLFIAYSAGLYGYCLIKGYNVSPKQLFSTSWPPTVTK